MNLNLMQNIPAWESRLQQKLLEKKAFIWNAALRGGAKGVGIGAGLGAAYGAGSSALSSDPNASVIGGALKGGLKGGMTGGALGAGAGAAMQASRQAMPGMASAAGYMGLPGLQAGMQNMGAKLNHFGNQAGITSRAVRTAPDWAPPWLANPMQWARTAPTQ